MTKVKQNTVAISVLLLLALLYHWGHLNDFPSHIHAWAQADRYALALGFVENGLNLFQPQTMIYNHQFPDWWMEPSDYTITAVDFPIHDFVPAILMKVTGDHAPFWFRGYILLYSLLGLFFLFRLVRSITQSGAAALFVLVFAATSPLFVYYQANFLPTIPSLANAIIGAYFYHRYLCKGDNRMFWWSSLAFTLAALSRTTFVIPLLAMFGVEFLRVVFSRTPWIPKVAPVGVSLLSLIAYALYNSYLRNQYGSQFLSELMPAESIANARELLSRTWENWGEQYFSSLHYLCFGVLAALVVFTLLKRWKHETLRISPFIGFILISFLGCVIFAFAMLNQFPAHDYYFLDTFYLPLVLLFACMVAYVVQKSTLREQRMYSLIALAATVMLVLVPFESQTLRRDSGPWDRTASVIQDFDNADMFLDSLGISENAKILVLDAVAPNLPFLLMKRKGYALMKPTRENLEQALLWDYDYAVFQNSYFVDRIFRNYPQLIEKLNVIASNGRITACRKGGETTTDLMQFLGFSDKQLRFNVSRGFEGKQDAFGWSNVKLTDKHSFSGQYAGVVAPEMEYGWTYRADCADMKVSGNAALVVSGFFLSAADSPFEAEVVLSIQDGNNTIHYHSFSLKEWLQDSGHWAEVPMVFVLPEALPAHCKIAVYLWNRGRGELYYDDISISLYADGHID